MGLNQMVIGAATRSMPDFPTMMAQLLAAIQQMSSDLRDLRLSLGTPIIASPDAVGEWAPLAAVYATAQQAQIIRLLVTADTTDIYCLKIGNDNQKFQFGLTAFVPQMLIMDGPARLYATAGLPLSVVQVTTGTAKVYPFACFIPGDNLGRKSK